MYHPRRALRNAILDWLPEFSKPKSAWGPIAKPQPAVAVVPVPIIPSINTCMSLTTTTTTTSTGTAPVVNSNQLQALAEVCSTVGVQAPDGIVPGPVMNSLVSETKVVCNDSIPNPITPVPVPVAVPLNKEVKSITILNGTRVKTEKEGGPMNADGSNDVSNESSLSPSEPMDCNSTPSISPAHAGKHCSSSEDVAMSETLVSRCHHVALYSYHCMFSLDI